MRTALAAESILDKEARNNLIYAGASVALGMFLFVFWCLLGVVLSIEFPIFRAVSIGLWVVVGMTAGAIIISGKRWGRGYASGVINALIAPVPVEINVNSLTPVAPSALLALPTPEPEAEPIQYNHWSRGGELIARKLLHGFEPGDLEWLTKYLANGGKFTEAAMENMPLPHSGEKLGKAQENTPYTRFMQLCIEAGIIVGREGKRSGTLAILSAPEMMQAIRSLPEA